MALNSGQSSSALSSTLPTSPSRSVFTDGTFAIRGAQQFSAVKRGQASSMAIAQRDGVFDTTARLNLPRLHDLLTGPARSELVPYFTSATDSGIANALAVQLQRANFEPHITRRLPGRRETGVDLAFGLAIVKGTQALCEGDVVTLVAGDVDFMPVVEDLLHRGLYVDIVGWAQATSQILIARARKFIPLDPYFDTLCFNTDIH